MRPRDGRGEGRGARPRRRLGLAVVRGRSMLPTLRDGDRLLVWHGGVPRVGRTAVVRLPVSGGVPVVAVKRVTRREQVAPGRGGWWVERDNPVEGVDSWSVGAVPDEDVLAVVLCRVWPPRRRVAPRMSRRPHAP